MSISGSYNLPHNNKGIWVISEDRYSDFDLSGVIDEKVDGPCREYKISDIGRYLLNPHSIEVKKKLIGGEIHFKQGTIKKIRKSISKIMPAFLGKRKLNPALSPEVIVSRYKLRIPSMKDPELEAYLNETHERHDERVYGKEHLPTYIVLVRTLETIAKACLIMARYMIRIYFFLLRRSAP